MERLLNLAKGYVALEVRGVAVEEFLNLCAKHGVRFWQAEPVESFTLRLRVYRSDAKRAMALAERAGCEARRVSEKGVPGTLRGLRRRYALFLGFVAFTALMAWSSLHIWEIEVTGNETVGDWKIISALDSIGVGVGSFWPGFTSDNIRSEALVLLPELSWLTVNVSGSRAEVIVRERIPVPEIHDVNTAADIVAGKAGAIVDLRVLCGEKLAQNGQTVAKGDKLVSGAVSSSFAPLRFEHSKAEVYANTWYTICAKRALTVNKNTEEKSTKRYFSLIIGDKRINFYKSSGIFTSDCDKISLEHQLALKGVFTLPISLEEIRLTEYESEEAHLDAAMLREELKQELYDSLLSRIGEDGSIVQYSFSFSESDGVLTATIHAQCLEQIGVERELSPDDIAYLKQAEQNLIDEGETDNDREDNRG